MKHTMKLSELKTALGDVKELHFKMQNGTAVPEHAHVTEAGVINKHFFDCGGKERRETVFSLQIWEGTDHHHRLAPNKLLNIIDLCSRSIGAHDHQIEIEYQQSTVGKFGLIFDGTDFILTNQQTKCLAKDSEKSEHLNASSIPNQTCCADRKATGHQKSREQDKKLNRNTTTRCNTSGGCC